MSLGKNDVIVRLREARDARAGCAIATVLDDDRARGFPFATVVPFGLDGQDRVVIVVSDLAVHTRNLRRDPRASVAIAEPGADPQRGWRLSIVGRFVEDDRARAAYAGTWPIPALPDFHAFVLQPRTARLVAGFGAMAWIELGAASDEP
jgi:putative heme iron utilization protein